jgi:alpha-L-rhamnosidase
MRREEPGYGNWIERGATTLWEDWQGHSSLNHVMFGDISAWMQHWIAGLQPGEDGWRRFQFRPHAIEGVTEAACSHLTPWGRAAISWKLSDQLLRAEIEIPAGTEATIFAQEGATLELIDRRRDASSILQPGRHTLEIRLKERKSKRKL